MNDEEQIRSTVQTYFDCMYESSSEKTHAAFHPSAKITGYLTLRVSYRANNRRQKRRANRRG
jgi:hypothetical protein